MVGERLMGLKTRKTALRGGVTKKGRKEKW